MSEITEIMARADVDYFWQEGGKRFEHFEKPIAAGVRSRMEMIMAALAAAGFEIRKADQAGSATKAGAAGPISIGESAATGRNLLRETWTDLDSDELRLLLREQFGAGNGQYDGDDGKLHLPLAGAASRIVLTFANSKIEIVEPGVAFDAAEWKRVSHDIEHSVLAGVPKTGRDYSFSSFPVRGSWRGRRSGVQILPAPERAPRSGGASDPFILEFPIKGSDLLFITNHRRIREHRKLTLLLNALLAATRTSCLPQRQGHFWASIPSPEEAKPSEIKWVQEFYYAPLDCAFLDEPSPPSAELIEEIEPEEYYTKVATMDAVCGCLPISMRPSAAIWAYRPMIGQSSIALPFGSI